MSVAPASLAGFGRAALHRQIRFLPILFAAALGSGTYEPCATSRLNKGSIGFAAQTATIRSVPKLLQTCSTEGFQVVLPVRRVFGWYLAGDPRQ